MCEKENRYRLPFLNNGVAQVGLIVEDLDKAVENYWNLFGIGPWHFYTYGKPLVKKMTYHGEPAEYKMRIALSYLGPLRIELIEMVQGDTVYADFVAEHGYGVHHFGVLVEDMEAALAEAKAAGLTMTMDGAGFGRDGDGHYAYLDTEDRLGVTIELIERPKDRMTPEKVFPPEDSSRPVGRPAGTVGRETGRNSRSGDRQEQSVGRPAGTGTSYERQDHAPSDHRSSGRKRHPLWGASIAERRVHRHLAARGAYLRPLSLTR